MTNSTNPTHIPTTSQRNEPGFYKSPATVIIEGGSRAGGPAGWRIGGWNVHAKARTEFQGPMVQGPVAYCFGIASVIDNHGGTKREREEADAKGLLIRVSDGDLLEIDGVEYKLTLNPRGYPKLTVAA